VSDDDDSSALARSEPGSGAAGTPAADASPPELDREIPATLSAPSTARTAVRSVLANHPVALGRLEALTLLVSEIVSNAVTHAQAPEGSQIELSVAVTASFTRILVSDAGAGFEPTAAALPDLAAVTARSPAAADFSTPSRGARAGGGYGLALLDALASRWGTLHAPGRFSVWFELDHAPAQAA